MRYINLDLCRATEAGAISASNWVGSGNKLAADKAATDAIRNRLNKMNFAGMIKVGEGKKDGAAGLFAGECVGIHGKKFCGRTPPSSAAEAQEDIAFAPTLFDIAIDPIDGTTPTVSSGPEAMSVLAIAGEGAMFSTEKYYMKKLSWGPKISNKVKLNLNDPLQRTIELASLALDKAPQKITVCILNRLRHQSAIQELRELGVRIKLIQDCDISGAVSTCMEDSGIDFLYGIGGATEAVLSACAIKCLGGGQQSQLSDSEGNISGPVMELEDLVKGPCTFVATGITDGSLLRGVQWKSRGPVTNSIFMRSESGTFRILETHHGN